MFTSERKRVNERERTMVALQIAKNHQMGKFQKFTLFTKAGKPFKGSASTAPFPCKLNQPLATYDTSLISSQNTVKKLIDGNSDHIYIYGFSDSEALINYIGAYTVVPLNQVILDSIQWHVNKVSANYKLDEQSIQAFVQAYNQAVA